MQGKVSERNNISIRLETAIVYVFGEFSDSISSISPTHPPPPLWKITRGFPVQVSIEILVRILLENHLSR